MERFEFIEHTADIGIRVFSKTLEGLFKNSAIVLFGIILDYKPEKKIKEEVILQAESLEEVYVTWLNELLSIFAAYRFLPVEYNLTIEKKDQNFLLKAVLYGDNFDPESKALNIEIKAATYHDLKIEKRDNLYVAEVIFDI